MSNDNKRLTESIRRLIRERRLTQVEVAKAAGMKPQQLNDTLSGEVSPRLETVERIAKALGVPVYKLLMPDETAKPSATPSTHVGTLVRLIRRLDAEGVQDAIFLVKGILGESDEQDESGKPDSDPSGAESA